MRFEGGPLDGRETNLTASTEIPIYGRGYTCKPTRTLVYKKVGKKLVYQDPRRKRKTVDRA